MAGERSNKRAVRATCYSIPHPPPNPRCPHMKLRATSAVAAAAAVDEIDSSFESRWVDPCRAYLSECQPNNNKILSKQTKKNVKKCSMMVNVNVCS